MKLNKKSFLRGIRWGGLLLSFALLGFGIGKNYESKKYHWYHETQGAVRNGNVDLSEFWRVWGLLKEKYVDEDKLNPQKMVYGAIGGMVQALGDPYTRFFPPEDNKLSEENLNGSFYGVGIELGYKDGQLAVIAPLEDGPAKKMGVKAGDYILHIKDETKGIDEDTQGMSLIEAVKKIRGELGKPVTLTLYRKTDKEPKPFEVTIIREKILIPSLKLTWVEKKGKKIAHLSLFQFGGRTEAEWNKAVREILKQGAGGLVLDLRDNPGGYLEGAIFISGEFLPEGKVVVKQQGRYSTKTYTVSRQGRLLNLPMVVIVNKGSASASEITAGALQANKRAKVVGEKSFGKGTVQSVEDLPDGASLHVTVAKWLLPNDQWINEAGITPDVEIQDNPNTEEDEVLEKAVNLVLQ